MCILAVAAQVVMVRVVNAATGEPLLEAPEGMKLVASLLGPYYEKESTHDVTFAKEDWTSAEFEQVTVIFTQPPSWMV